MLGKNNMYFRPLKSLGQNFLINENIAKTEAEYAYNRNVLEIGPGYGILTQELCSKAKSVTAVEKDSNLFSLLKVEIKKRNLRLIRGDFFEIDEKELGIDGIDILISNIPYSLSSKVISWVINKKKEALLCMQREFVEHMLAMEGTKKYSKLSVISHLALQVTKIMDVSKGNFRPMPKVDSTIVFIRPKGTVLDSKVLEILGAIMQHKKKTVRNAIVDSRSSFRITKENAFRIAEKVGRRFGEEKLFMLPPEVIFEIAKELKNELNNNSALQNE